jgi:hypothetical protein
MSEAEEFKEITLGLDAEAFLRGNVGQALAGKAQNQAVDAMEDLKTLKRSAFNDSTAFEAEIIRLQGIIERAENFEFWLIELVQEGRNAEELMEQSEFSD